MQMPYNWIIRPRTGARCLEVIFGERYSNCLVRFHDDPSNCQRNSVKSLQSAGNNYGRRCGRRRMRQDSGRQGRIQEVFMMGAVARARGYKEMKPVTSEWDEGV